MDQHKESSFGLEFVVDIKPDDRSLSKASASIIDERTEFVVGRLLKAHEEECRRISREIHDDLGGRITEIALLIQQIKKSTTIPKAIVSKLDQLRDKAVETSRVIGKLSHRLHSPVLEFTGITVALESVCREFQAHTGIQVEFVAIREPADVPSEIALCLYRIAQESLSNIAKHSDAKSARVELTSRSEEVQLTIRDTGHGFRARSRRTKGLGLISMQERVRLLQGTLQIQTRAGAGTLVRTTLPFKPQSAQATPRTKHTTGHR
jgi:signal transduction histidine kinase